MMFSDFIEIVEILIIGLAAIGIVLSGYLLRAERRDRALTVAENGRTGILSWSLVMNESLRVAAMVVLFIVGIISLITPNQKSPASIVSPLIPIMVVLFSAISVTQSVILISARRRIAHYPRSNGVAKQSTLLEVQKDVEKVSEKVAEVKEAAHAAYEEANTMNQKILDLAKRTTDTEDRADVSEGRADESEDRADAAEKRERK